MKVVVVNGSPRINWNTAMLLKEVVRGAEENGDEVEYINLFSLKFLGCRSCLACKLKNIDEPYKCHYKDELTPILDKILEADKLVIGSPIYFSEPTSAVRSLLERLTFPPLSYNNYQSIFNKKIDVDVILTMNAPESRYESGYKKNMESYFAPFHLLKGKVRIFPICDTLQVNDYSRYEMKSFSESHKKERRENEFTKELEFMYRLGKGEIK